MERIHKENRTDCNGETLFCAAFSQPSNTTFLGKSENMRGFKFKTYCFKYLPKRSNKEILKSKGNNAKWKVRL
jgi:hypothetical protein